MKPEIVGAFRKSSYSGQEGDCVEVARTADADCVVRDSKQNDGAWLVIGANAWTSLLATLKADSTAAA
ncbi:DUF397 domain-containing protein [Streptomyces sp. NPDC001339]|uniref:DUF397 domain-containing protein n=1 Tax=Streptomyces sp. NPDC001339 TaxID=3364563 RepID=UPI003686BC6A